MNLDQTQYSSFGLVRDMLATADVIANFDADQAKDTAGKIAQVGKLHLTGEGSSRIFPAKHAMMQARRAGWKLALHTDAGRQSQEYDLADWAVFAASNSGKTSEVIKLFTDLKAKGHNHRYGLTASDGSKLGELSNQCYVLKCGPEGAVAATKSVVEQALFYHAMLEHAVGKPSLGGKLKTLASHVREALTTPIDPEADRQDRQRRHDLLRRPQRRRRGGADAQDERDHAQEERLSSRAPTPCTASKRS